MDYLEKICDRIFDCILATVLCVFAVIGRQLDYLIHYKSNINNLKTQVKELREARYRVWHDVEVAKRNVQEIEVVVETWLTHSDAIIVEAEEFFEDNRQAKMMCCNGWCPNLNSRYQLSKRAYKIGLEVKEIKEKCKFDRVGYQESTQGVRTPTSNKGYESFESRMKTITGVLDALKDANINKIGVYGMGGIGKTMIVKEVVEHAQKDKLFDMYPFVVVSQDPDVKKIQKEIADQVDLKLDVESESVRAAILHKRLQQEKILVVIDDIWQPLDLEALGIPLGDDKKGCKLLLTSRFQDVLRNDMDTQKEFLIGVLADDEARNLFEKVVGNLAKFPELQPSTAQIVKECAGLPIAITTIANALKNQKNVNVWKDVLKQLKLSGATEIEGMHEKVYTSIKLSYQFLKSREAKSLFLICSLHGEDCEIKVEDLMRYGVGLGLFHNIDRIEDARYRVHTLVERLKVSCLLLDGNGHGMVKMHDIIRDVAINIAAEEKHMFTIRSAIDLQERSKWTNSIAISLPYDVCELPKKLECSKLQLFLLFRQKDSFQIPNSFFEGLKKLKVLKLTQAWPAILPSSLSSLENLQTLCLDGEVQDIIIIGELKNLKALTLSLSNIKQLPKEIGQLTHLQLLDFENCFQLRVIPPNVLSNLKRLEELYMPGDVEWDVEVESTGRSNAFVSELDHLSHLTTLHIHIPNPKILPKALIFERLVRYRIVIGGDMYWYDEFEVETSRNLRLNISFQANDGIKALLKCCEALYLTAVKGVKNILYELDLEGFQHLKHLNVKDNTEIQCVIKSVGVLGIAFPVLESIVLRNMINLEWICHCQLTAESFRNLRVIKVTVCDNLKFVLSSSMGGCFSQLQEMEIGNCKVMSSIVAMERIEEIEFNGESTPDLIEFAKLHSLKLLFLPKLKGFYSDVDSHVLFNKKVFFPFLEKLKIESLDSIQMIWHNQLISDSFRKLETMTVSLCDNLTNIFPPNMLRRLQNLRHLEIFNCHSIEGVFEIQETNVEEIGDMAATELRYLTLSGLPKVKHVWSADPQGIFTFQKLRSVKIYACHSLKSVFPTSVAKGLIELEELKIEDCAVEEIVAKGEGIETIISFVFPRLTSLELRKLPELKSFYPGKHTSAWPSLKKLDIYKCYKLKIFGSNEFSVQETNGLDHHVMPIQQPLFHIEKEKFPNLEELKLEGGDAMNETSGGPPAEFFCNIKFLKLYRKKPSVIVGNEDSQSGCTFPNLEPPTVSEFCRLKNIVPFSRSFQNLTTLELRRCDALISLFTPSTAKSLVQLQKISILKCKRMTEIVTNEGAVAGDEITFKNLILLEFHNLSSLTGFHLGNCTIKFPSLDYVIVIKCPKLKVFSNGVLSTPKLKDIDLAREHNFPVNENIVRYRRFTKAQQLRNGDLNAAIKRFWENNFTCA